MQEWLLDRPDDSIQNGPSEWDEQSVMLLLRSMTSQLESTNVYDLASLQETVTATLPILKSNEATQPYAAWLEAHIDYLETAKRLWRRRRPPPSKPDAPPPPPQPPSQETQREVWNETLEKRPMPARAQKYVPRLKPIFTAQGVPPVLVWLAEVESSFNPEARSPVGAVGLFQFMPATAKSLGLYLSPEDERINPDKSARAASQYLRYLHGRFQDWRLALAAYNAGETRVYNLLVRHKTKSFDVIAPSLPAETQMYVPKIEATLRKREGVALKDLELAQSQYPEQSPQYSSIQP